jgi:hypothetical protein
MVANGTQSHNGQSAAAPITDPHGWQQEYRQVHSWRQAEPPVLYTAKWTSPDGIEHLLCVRGDTLEELLPQVRTITQMIWTAKEKQAATLPTNESNRPTTSVQPPSVPEGWCSTHSTQMARRKWGGYSHKLSNGTWCKGDK